MSTLNLHLDVPTENIYVWALISDNVAEKVAFDLNNALFIHLHRAKDVTNPLVKTEPLFLHFYYEHRKLEHHWWLISNLAYHSSAPTQNRDGLFAERLENLPLLMPALRIYNYFLVAEAYFSKADLQRVKHQFKNSPSLRSAESVNLKRIKNIENLIYPEYVNKPSKNSINLRPRVRKL